MNCGRAEEEDIYGNSQVVVSFFQIIFTPILGEDSHFDDNIFQMD